MTSIGPELPPHLQHLRQQQQDDEQDDEEKKRLVEEEDDDEDDYTPALPPDMLPSNNPSNSVSQPSSSTASASASHTPYHSNDYDDDSDDDVGPQPLPAHLPAASAPDPVAEFIAREERRKKEAEDAAKPKKAQRDEWMLVPPSAGGVLGSLDPAKLQKPRQFSRSSAPSSSTSSKRTNEPNLWTETPAERQQRLADEVLGKKRPAIQKANDETEDERLERKRRKLVEEEVRKGVREHTERVRGRALVDQHEEGGGNGSGSGKDGKGKDADGKDLGIWDHSRDMAVSGRVMDDGQRNKMIRDARGLGDRFGSGSGGGFL